MTRNYEQVLIATHSPVIAGTARWSHSHGAAAAGELCRVMRKQRYWTRLMVMEEKETACHPGQ